MIIDEGQKIGLPAPSGTIKDLWTMQEIALPDLIAELGFEAAAINSVNRRTPKILLR
jgi:hypothetical protein